MNQKLKATPSVTGTAKAAARSLVREVLLMELVNTGATPAHSGTICFMRSLSAAA